MDLRVYCGKIVYRSADLDWSDLPYRNLLYDWSFHLCGSFYDPEECSRHRIVRLAGLSFCIDSGHFSSDVLYDFVCLDARAGGSYIYASRSLHPYLGFVARFSQWFGLSILMSASIPIKNLL